MPESADLSLAAMLTRAALAAGAAILDIYAKPIAVTEKADRTPVTEADARAEEIILAHLAAAEPGTMVIAEEASAVCPPGAAPERFFLVDPLDGTREFVGRNGEFTVNIALIEDGWPTAGVVLAPAAGRLFIAAGPDAAFAADAATGAADPADPARWRPIAARAPGPDGLAALVSRSHGDAETEAWLARQPVARRVAAGSSLKFCLIAAGEADVYPRFGRTMEWDTAAGQAVLEAAGGGVHTLDGGRLAYGKAEAGYANPPFIARGRDA